MLGFTRKVRINTVWEIKGTEAGAGFLFRLTQPTKMNKAGLMPALFVGIDVVSSTCPRLEAWGVRVLLLQGVPR